MPAPSSSLATLRPDLAGSLMEFDLAMSRRGFIAPRVLPVVEVMKSSGKFGKIPLAQLLQARDAKRASKAGYDRGNFTFTDGSFATEEYGLEELIDDREAELYSSFFDAEVVSTARAFDGVLREYEKRVAALVFNTTTWTGSALTTAVGTEWSTFATATPIDDVEAAIKKVWDGTGFWPNSLIVTRRVFRNLRQCTQVIDRIQASGSGDRARSADITEDQLRAVFDLDQIIVADAAKNTANEGAAAVIADLWDDEYAMVARIAETNDIREPCVGRTFHWSEDGSMIGGTIEAYRDETHRADVVRVRHDVDELVLYAAAGHLLSNVTA